MTKAQAGNEKMLNEMKAAMAEILKKYDLDSYKMSSYVTYGDIDSKISFSFTELNDHDMFESHLKHLRYFNDIGKHVTVEMFKGVTVIGPKNTLLQVTEIKSGRPYKVILSNGSKQYSMNLGVFLNTHAPHLKHSF